MSDPTEEFLWKVHAYNSEANRFADTKALAVVAWSSALIAGLYDSEVHFHFTKASFSLQPEWGATSLAVFSFLAFAILVAAAAIALLGVRPNLASSSKDGLIFWKHIRLRKTGADYHSSVSSCESYSKEIASHVHDLAAIAERKYYLVNRSIETATVGSFVAFLVVIFG